MAFANAFPKVVNAEFVIHGVIKLVFTDGYEDIVDLRPVVAKNDSLAWLRKPENFQKLRLEQDGHRIFWIDDNGQQLDFVAQLLRELAEKQTKLRRLAG
jgi:Protein of unknown function (DUF2442)